MIPRKSLIMLLVMLPLYMTACSRAVLDNRASALRAGAQPHLISDDLAYANLAAALRAQIEKLAAQGSERTLTFGPYTTTAVEYAAHLTPLLDTLESGDPQAFLKQVAADFEFLEIYGGPAWGETFVTSYFEPVLQGSLRPGGSLTQPLYRKPPEMLALDPGIIDAKYSGDRKMRARIENGAILPFFSREEIDSGGALSGRGLEICWVDPVDAFFLHVQGSGTVVLDDGTEMKLNYADKNGHPYKSLGPALRERMPDADLTADVIENFLRSLTREEQQQYLNLNPSYVFFIESQKNAVTSSGIPAIPGRTVAADGRYFPKGALAYLEFEKPVMRPGEELPGGKETAARFVFDQDSGGAITGGGRVDLFWGRGAEAKKFAGRVKSSGRMWYLFPKKLAAAKNSSG